MISNYLLLALRSLAKDKLRASIEIFGLSIGLACCLLILLFVQYETSFDRFHSRQADLYRAWVKEDYGNNQVYFNTHTPIALSEAIERSIPGIEKTVRLGVIDDVVMHDERRFNRQIHLVDEGFFQIFDFQLLAGDPGTALSDPHFAVLTEDTALRLFGRSRPLGESFSIRFGDHFEEFQVSGVAARPPANSSIRFEIVIPFQMSTIAYGSEARESWFSVMVETYVLLERKADVADVARRFPGMLSEVLGDRYERSGYQVGLQPLSDVHLDTDFPQAIAPVSDPAYSYILGGIALLILTIACINYMTLSIGRSAQRATEVAVRKSMGADRANLMRQFWGEAFLTTLMALGVGIVLAEALRPLFNELAGVKLGSVASVEAIALSLVLCLIVGLISGSYPAAVLSGHRSVDVLKGEIKIAGDRSAVRRGLVVLQFALSVFLIAATLVMGRQFRYLKAKPLGFDSDHVVAVPLIFTGNADRRAGEVIREGISTAQLIAGELAGRPGIRAVTSAGHTFGEPWTSIGFKDADGRYYDMHMNAVDARYLDAMGMTIVEGRGFSSSNPSDARRSIVVNQSLVREFGLRNPVGGRLPGTRFPDHEIIGVVEDFHYESLHGGVRPLVLTLDPDLVFRGASDVSFEVFPSPKLFVRIAGSHVPGTLSLIDETLSKVIPDTDYEFSFLDASIDGQYRQDRRLAKIVRLASILAILIACLGLFGLAGLAAIRRTKEIGIRKVLGASTGGVFWLLARDLGWLAALSTLFAAPAVYIVMERWLNDFAYRVPVSPDVYLLACLIATGIAFLTVGYQGIRAARMDPVKSLRYE